MFDASFSFYKKNLEKVIRDEQRVWMYGPITTPVTHLRENEKAKILSAVLWIFGDPLVAVGYATTGLIDWLMEWFGKRTREERKKSFDTRKTHAHSVNFPSHFNSTSTGERKERGRTSPFPTGNSCLCTCACLDTVIEQFPWSTRSFFGHGETEPGKK